MLTFRFSGADGQMVTAETLTCGMVGKEVKLEFSTDWDDLSKTTVFTAGTVTRDVVGAADVVTIPAEVLAQPLQRLYVGVYGVSTDGKVTPTVRAEGPMILPGADPSGDEGTDPELAVWAQLQREVDNIPAMVEDAMANAKASGEFDGADGGYYTPLVSQPDEQTMVFAWKASTDTMPAIPTMGITLPVSGVRTVNGKEPDSNGNINVATGGGIDYDQNVHSVNHRGYSAIAPENTIPAYILSKQMGFTYVEADVSFTSDGVAVLLHDSTIDRTSNGSGSISAMTYAQASQYDYGSWKSTAYTGTRIPTFEEFLILCKRIGLHPYIELKQNGAYTQEQIQALVELVRNCGMEGRVTWISFAPSYLEYVKTADPAARLGYLVSAVTSAVITTAQGLRTDTNEVFIDSSDYDADAVSRCQAAGFPLEIWTINSSAIIESMDPYITGVTSDSLIAGKILYDVGMVYAYGIDGAHVHSYTSAVTTAATCTTAGAKTYTCACGDTYTASIPATGHSYVEGICTVCGAVDPDYDPDVTLTGISAAYSGGDVPVGTALTDLTGIVVTVEYSNGTTETVTGYTLSGTIAEGSNTITVTYGGMTATFQVTGVAVDESLLCSWDFTQSLTDSESGKQGYIYESAVQDTEGLHFTASKDRVDIGGGFAMGRTFEIDVTEMGMTNIAADHGRFVMFNGVEMGFIYRYNTAPGWAFYGESGWSESLSTDLDLFVGHTCKLVVDAEGIVTVYVDGTEIGSSGVPVYTTAGLLAIGSSMGSGCYPVTITGLRIRSNA